jgi:hypothetical protein
MYVIKIKFHRINSVSAPNLANERKSYLSTEVAEVLRVLADLHLLDNLTQTGTIASTVLADDPHLLRAFGL